MRILVLKTCDTCRTALRALRAAGHDPEVVEIGAGIPEDDRAAILAAHGEAALNRASATWRGLTEAERGRGPAELLAAHPKLMKRPMILHEGRWLRGWGPDSRAALGL